MNDDLLILRLAVQNSLIGCVTSELRAVYVKIENKITEEKRIINFSYIFNYEYGLPKKHLKTHLFSLFFITAFAAFNILPVHL